MVMFIGVDFSSSIFSLSLLDVSKAGVAVPGLL